MKERIKYIDLLKFFAIFLVICGHVIQQFHPLDYKYNKLFIGIYSFHMPLFMLISGFLFYNKLCFIEKWQNVYDILKDKSNRLIIPLLVWTSIIFFFLFPANGGGEWIGTEYLTSFWFLRCLFLTYLICAIIYIVSKRVVFLFVLLCLLFPQIGSIFTTYHVAWLMPAFICGLMLKKYDSSISFNNWRVITLICGFLWLMSFYYFDFSVVMVPAFNLSENIVSGKAYTDIHAIKYIYKILIGLIGSLFFFGAFKVIFHENRFDYSLISKIGQSTLIIYILQNIYLERIMSRYLDLSGINHFVFNYILTPAIALTIAIVCYITSLVINKNRLSSYLLLGNRLKKE